MRLDAELNALLPADEELKSIAGSNGGLPAAPAAELTALPNNVKFRLDAAAAAASSSSAGSSSSSAQYLHHGPVKLPIKVTNIATQHQLVDTLYNKSKSISCTNHACLGSIMSQPVPAHIVNNRNNEEILDQAVEFLEQYFIYLKKLSSSDLAQRLAEIATEVERTGTYTMTTDELHFGAKTAWRNASRCIGRIQWHKLQLNDARHVRTTQEMFDALCKHIQLATNDGNLRSFITVFPQRIPGRDDYRVWNSQLISYAGYIQPDGTIIGDPGRAEFTRICQRLGWKGNNGRFDVLPIVLSAPGEGVRFYEIPDDIVLRVKIKHPMYEWFEDKLKLEWYALPAVSEMMFDCGGLQYTGCPFNGWYMGTEIGARDFCDVQRYNLSEKIATLMGLDTSNVSTLWKDRALVEMNVAVLHSYQKMGVTIVDHHSASDQFIKHMNSEYKQRGGCPADWVWIVPPISASVTPVFHQEMINYTLRPSFEYQDKAWKTHKWMTSVIKLKYKFASIAKGTLWTVRLMSKILSTRIKVTILYATETGKSETFAHKLAKLMQTSFCVKRVVCMDEYLFDDLFAETLVLIVTSTFGNGDAPDNGKDFWKQLSKLSQTTGASDMLKHLSYSVFALGSTQYPSFCAFGKNLDKTLKCLGATSVLPIGLGDDMRGQDKTFKNWCHDCYSQACQAFDINIADTDLTLSSFDTNDNVYDHQKVRIAEMLATNDTTTENHNVHNELARLHRKRIISCKIITRVRLQAKQSERQTLLVRLTPSNPMAKSQLNYKPGDHLAIFPCNPKEPVNALLGHLSRSGYTDPDAGIQLQRLVDGKWLADTRLPQCLTLRSALTQYLDISSPPNQKFLSYLVDMANDNWDSFRLNKLANDIDDYQKWYTHNCPTLADVLNEFPSIHVDPEFLLTELPLLQPRYYSISSSQKSTPDEVHLTMDVVSYHIYDGMGPKRLGVCSNYIDKFPETDIACFLRSAPSFRLPENKSLPVIMIGAGSGIAPYRSFWIDRQADLQNGESCGKMLLFFGCRSSQFDNIYDSDLKILLRKGVLHDLFVAYSREKTQKKHYIQDLVFKQRAMIYWLITNENAHIYVCGHSPMADGVKKCFVKVFESEANIGETDAQQQLSMLINEGRYHEDVFGLTHT